MTLSDILLQLKELPQHLKICNIIAERDGTLRILFRVSIERVKDAVMADVAERELFNTKIVAPKVSDALFEYRVVWKKNENEVSE